MGDKTKIKVPIHRVQHLVHGWIHNTRFREDQNRVQKLSEPKSFDPRHQNRNFSGQPQQNEAPPINHMPFGNRVSHGNHSTSAPPPRNNFHRSIQQSNYEQNFNRQQQNGYQLQNRDNGHRSRDELVNKNDPRGQRNLSDIHKIRDWQGPSNMVNGGRYDRSQNPEELGANSLPRSGKEMDEKFSQSQQFHNQRDINFEVQSKIENQFEDPIRDTAQNHDHISRVSNIHRQQENQISNYQPANNPPHPPLDQNPIQDTPSYYEKYKGLNKAQAPIMIKKKTTSIRNQAQQNFDPRQSAQPLRSSMSRRMPRNNHDTDVTKNKDLSTANTTPMEEDMPSTSSDPHQITKQSNNSRPFTNYDTDASDGEASRPSSQNSFDFLSLQNKRKRRLETKEGYRNSVALKSILKISSSSRTKMSRSIRKIDFIERAEVLAEFEIEEGNTFEPTTYCQTYSDSFTEETELPKYTKEVELRDANNQGSVKILLPNMDDEQIIKKRKDPKKSFSSRAIKDYQKDVRKEIDEAFKFLGGPRSEKRNGDYFHSDWWISDSLMWLFNEKTLPRTYLNCFDFPITPEWVNDILEKNFPPELKRDVVIKNIYYTLGYDMITCHSDFDGISAEKAMTDLVQETANFISWVERFFQDRYIDTTNTGIIMDEHGKLEKKDNIILPSKYKQVMPTVILITIPEIGPLESFAEYNEHVRDFVQNYKREWEASLKDRRAPEKPRVELLDWATLILNSDDPCRNLEERFQVLMEEAHMKFGLIRMCDRRKECDQ
uniref:Uncharacterized protein n=1 Tax=Acrobeloides nanus TaxID=290746 RepID=A0A914DVK9_9BILA